jgi:hypothetical protein
MAEVNALGFKPNRTALGIEELQDLSILVADVTIFGDIGYIGT